ncbi:LOW QUALITY PROTEIN: protein BNIP5 [Dasypus novemcinctus]|uniref:LOW QUALITY PROTEIN: protein BNIP5 n=1 Tax=Dasypus novemcinctus TaxID=9361 RepID=UPI0039C9ECAB
MCPGAVGVPDAARGAQAVAFQSRSDFPGLSPMETPRAPRKPRSRRKAQSLDRPQAPGRALPPAPARRLLHRSVSDGDSCLERPAWPAAAPALRPEESEGLLPGERRPPRDPKRDRAAKRGGPGWLKALLNVVLRTGPEEPRERAGRRPKGRDGLGQPGETPAGPAPPSKGSHKRSGRRRPSAHKKPVGEDTKAAQDPKAGGRGPGLPRTAASRPEEAGPGPARRGGEDPALPRSSLTGAGASALSSRATGRQPGAEQKPGGACGSGLEEPEAAEALPPEVGAASPVELPARAGTWAAEEPLQLDGAGASEEFIQKIVDLPQDAEEPGAEKVGRRSLPTSPLLPAPAPLAQASSCPSRLPPSASASARSGAARAGASSLPPAPPQAPGRQGPDSVSLLAPTATSSPASRGGCRKPGPGRQEEIPGEEVQPQESLSTQEAQLQGAQERGGGDAASPAVRPPRRPSFLPLCVGGHRPSASSVLDLEPLESQGLGPAAGGLGGPPETASGASTLKPEGASESKDAILQRIVEFLQKVGDEWEEKRQAKELATAPQNPAPAVRKKSQEKKPSVQGASSPRKHDSAGPRRAAAGTACAQARPPRKHGFLPMCVGGQRPSIPSSSGEQASSCPSRLPPSASASARSGAARAGGFQSPPSAPRNHIQSQPPEAAPASRKKSLERKSSLRRVFQHKKHSSKEPRRGACGRRASPAVRPPRRPSFLPLCVGGHRPSASSVLGAYSPLPLRFGAPSSPRSPHLLQGDRGGPPETASGASTLKPEGTPQPEGASEFKKMIIQQLGALLQEVDGEVGEQIRRHPSLKRWLYELPDSTLGKLAATLRSRGGPPSPARPDPGRATLPASRRPRQHLRRPPEPHRRPPHGPGGPLQPQQLRPVPVPRAPAEHGESSGPKPGLKAVPGAQVPMRWPNAPMPHPRASRRGRRRE